jgi:hypothetical protein
VPAESRALPVVDVAGDTPAMQRLVGAARIIERAGRRAGCRILEVTHHRHRRSGLPAAPLAHTTAEWLTPCLSGNSACRAHRRLLDRVPHETFNEDGDEGLDAGGAELAVEASYPTLKVRSGDLFVRVPRLKSADDRGYLLVVRRLDLRYVRPRAAERGWRWRAERCWGLLRKLH